MENEVLKQALLYVIEKGYSILQLGPDKKPLWKWQEFQKKRATIEQIKAWYQQNPNTNVGIITGEISGITVIDVEYGGDVDMWPETFTVKTGGGGYHLYYQYQPGMRNGARVRELTDIRGDGGYVVAPPSMHQSGNRYVVCKDIPMAKFPIEMMIEIQKERDKAHQDAGGNKVVIQNLLKGVETGSRNDSAARMAGLILKMVKREEYNTTGWQLMVSWNSHNIPPLPDQELANTYQSIAKREFSKIGLGAEGETDVVHISESITSEDYSKPTPIGFETLDSQMKGGVRAGDLVIITGKSGEGKTTLAQNISINLSFAGEQSVWFSYEVINNNLYAKFKQMASAVNKNIKDVPIFLPKRNASGNLSWIKEKIIESQEKFKTNFVFIDHIDFITPMNLKSNDQRRMVLRDICQELKELAIELNIAVFLIAHVKKVQGREIEMQDIAESSGIYQLADFVLAVQRIYKRDKVDGGFVDVITDESKVRMLKNRIEGTYPEMKFIMDDNIIKSICHQ